MYWCDIGEANPIDSRGSLRCWASPLIKNIESKPLSLTSLYVILAYNVPVFIIAHKEITLAAIYTTSPIFLKEWEKVWFSLS